MGIHPFWSSAFAPSVALLGSRSSAERERSRSWLPASMDKDDLLSSLTPTPKELFPTADFLDFEMKLHRPLGCTVEESLADHPVTHVVFVSKVSKSEVIVLDEPVILLALVKEGWNYIANDIYMTFTFDRSSKEDSPKRQVSKSGMSSLELRVSLGRWNQ
jgi:hypothetical protein